MAEVVVCSEPPDEWVRYFEADVFDPGLDEFWLKTGDTRHPVHTDMICREFTAQRMFGGGREFFRIKVTYRREKKSSFGPVYDGGGFLTYLDPFNIGPDVLADWREVQP